MKFVAPVFALAALLPFVYLAITWKSVSRPSAPILKALSLGCILLALAQPEMRLPETRNAVLVLADTSNSLSGADLARSSALVTQMRRAQGRNWLQVVPFASQPRKLAQSELRGGVQFVHASGQAGNSTSLEAALSSAVFALPENQKARVALLTDGNENEGSSARSTLQLQRLGIPVDTFPIGEHNAANFELTSVSVPHHAYAGEQIPIDLTLRAPSASDARVELSAEGKSLGASAVSLKPGENSIRIHARVNFTGAAVLAGSVVAPGLGELPFREGINLEKARVLYLSQDPPGSETNLLAAFNEANFEVAREGALPQKELNRYQLIVLNNLDLNTFPAPAKSQLADYVKEGGGLLLIGGERQVYKEDAKMDALDRTLPAQLAPPKSPEGTCVALIIDKSSSMEGRKIELARLSAIGVVDHLRPIDTIGVLIFDNSFQWAVPVRRAEDKTLIKRLISGITPDGGTQIAPALSEAYRRTASSKTTFKHIVLLTDGISEEGDSLDLAREAVNHGITISTVGLGQDVNRSYLEKVAVTSGGKSYFLNDPAGLEQILLKDVKDYSGSTAVERPLTPLVAHEAEILNGITMPSAPPLKGYARYIAKPAADTVLQIDAERKDPLYVRWQYGLGRVGVFTSDAKSRWAEQWISWPGFDTFWINTARDLLSHSDRNQAAIRFDRTTNELTVSYHGEEHEGKAPELFAFGPGGFAKPVILKGDASGGYNGSVPIGSVRGLFRIRPAKESLQFPELGFYRGEDELLERGVNTSLLHRIAAFTGGRFNPPAASVFNADGRTLTTTFHFWPALLGAAVALTIAELVGRKWPVLKRSLAFSR